MADNNILNISLINSNNKTDWAVVEVINNWAQKNKTALIFSGFDDLETYLNPQKIERVKERNDEGEEGFIKNPQTVYLKSDIGRLLYLEDFNENLIYWFKAYDESSSNNVLNFPSENDLYDGKEFIYKNFVLTALSTDRQFLKENFVIANQGNTIKGKSFSDFYNNLKDPSSYDMFDKIIVTDDANTINSKTTTYQVFNIFNEEYSPESEEPTTNTELISYLREHNYTIGYYKLSYYEGIELFLGEINVKDKIFLDVDEDMGGSIKVKDNAQQTTITSSGIESQKIWLPNETNKQVLLGDGSIKIYNPDQENTISLSNAGVITAGKITSDDIETISSDGYVDLCGKITLNQQDKDNIKLNVVTTNNETKKGIVLSDENTIEIYNTEDNAATTSIKLNATTPSIDLTGNNASIKVNNKEVAFLDDDNSSSTNSTWSANKISQKPTVGKMWLLDLIYPVGSIYMNKQNPSNDSCPIEESLGGTWERIEDRFILAAGETFNNTTYKYTLNAANDVLEVWINNNKLRYETSRINDDQIIWKTFSFIEDTNPDETAVTNEKRYYHIGSRSDYPKEGTLTQVLVLKYTGTSNNYEDSGVIIEDQTKITFLFKPSSQEKLKDIIATQLTKDLTISGSWERYDQGSTGKNYALIDNTFNFNLSTGGEILHQLHEAELASHQHYLNHNVAIAINPTTGDAHYGPISEMMEHEKVSTAFSNGRDIPHNNMPPYEIAYMWKRTG